MFNAYCLKFEEQLKIHNKNMKHEGLETIQIAGKFCTIQN